MDFETLKNIVFLQTEIIEKLVIKQLSSNGIPIEKVPEKQDLKDNLNELKDLLKSLK